MKAMKLWVDRRDQPEWIHVRSVIPHKEGGQREDGQSRTGGRKLFKKKTFIR